jgi:hypothetical protein
VPAVLAVYNWLPKSDRHRRVQRLVERMFANWEKFQQPPRHPKWRDVNLAATVPGWTRWAPAEELLRTMREQQQQQAGAQQKQQPPSTSGLGKALGTAGPAAANLSEAERERLYREFQQWQQKQQQQRQGQQR